MTTEDFVQNTCGEICPACRGDNTRSFDGHFDSATAWEENVCDDCGATWTTTYTLTGYTDLKIPEAKAN